MKIYATNSGQNFADKIAKSFSSQVNDAEINKYPDGQTFVELHDIPHREDVIVVGNTKGDSELIELGMLVHTLKNHNIREMIVVIPYFGAGRQDRSVKDGQDVGAKFQAEIISALMPSWVLLADLHNTAIRQYFHSGIKVRELNGGRALFTQEIRRLALKDFIFVSADVGRLNWVRLYAREFGVGVASLDKRREGPGDADIYYIVGKVKNKNIIFIDDMIDTGGTVLKGAWALKDAGAKEIHLFATHLVFSKESYKKFSGGLLFTSLHGTDTIDTSGFPHDFKVHSMAELFADYIKKEIR